MTVTEGEIEGKCLPGTGLETNSNYPLASWASYLENLLALLNSTSPNFFQTPIFCCAYHHKF